MASFSALESPRSYTPPTAQYRRAWDWDGGRGSRIRPQELCSCQGQYGNHVTDLIHDSTLVFLGRPSPALLPHLLLFSPLEPLLNQTSLPQQQKVGIYQVPELRVGRSTGSDFVSLQPCSCLTIPSLEWVLSRGRSTSLGPGPTRGLSPNCVTMGRSSAVVVKIGT